MLVLRMLGERRGAGGLEEGGLADVALDVLGLLVLQISGSAKPESLGRGGGVGNGMNMVQAREALTTLSCDFAGFVSFALRSRLLAALAPWGRLASYPFLVRWAVRRLTFPMFAV